MSRLAVRRSGRLKAPGKARSAQGTAGGARERVARSLVRNVEIGSLQDAFLVSAVVMILVIRLQLWLTNYPQLGGGKLHIAHLLWGGVFMLIAIGMLISFLGRPLRMPAAIVGGIGFGFFIDEVGKFVTSDNDYFFKPTAAIIYVVFIGLYLVSHAMRRRRGLSSREYLVNAIDALGEAARRGLDEHARRRALELVDKADPADPMTDGVRGLLVATATVPAARPILPARLAIAVLQRYEEVVGSAWFARALAGFFVAWATLSLLSISLLALSLGLGVGGQADGLSIGDVHDVSFVNLASIASSLVAGALVVAGVWRLRRGERLDAYGQFERALLVQIFVGQFFSFVESEFSAVFGLGFDILLLITIRYMSRAEERLALAGPP